MTDMVVVLETSNGSGVTHARNCKQKNNTQVAKMLPIEPPKTIVQIVGIDPIT